MKSTRQIALFICWVLFFSKATGQGNVLATWPVGDPVCYLSFTEGGAYSSDTTGWELRGQYVHSNASCFMADDNDSILFQCNGTKVVNKRLELLENGDFLTDMQFYNVMEGPGTSVAQSVLALPKGNNTYWLFYYSYSDSLFASGTGSPDRLYYAIVDMNENNGAGKVVKKKMPVYKGIMGDCRLTAVRHANGRDWWMVNHGWSNDV
ncbi:MAG TPA: hypothetical protein PLW44_18885, partial [Chitinophagales bacterium]|nr:hypothetical protein [Chitinophagales bacterium]